KRRIRSSPIGAPPAPSAAGCLPRESGSKLPHSKSRASGWSGALTIVTAAPRAFRNCHSGVQAGTQPSYPSAPLLPRGPADSVPEEGLPFGAIVGAGVVAGCDADDAGRGMGDGPDAGVCSAGFRAGGGGEHLGGRAFLVWNHVV